MKKNHTRKRQANTSETCYMCEKLATGKDHVPPKCFFPEQKDMPNTNFRDNPIKVPSCKEHNNDHSKDDEYLLVCIASHWQNNPIAYEHANTKVLRSLKNSKLLWEQFFGNREHLLINRGGELGITASLNKIRFDAEVEKIARGIYFHQFKRKSTQDIVVYSRSLVALLKERQPALEEIARINEISRGLISIEAKHGEHPDIFYYQFLQSSELTEFLRPSGIIVPISRISTIIRFVFYGGFEVTAVFKELGQT